MSIEVVSFVFGGLLVLVAILGGGFELKELRIPVVGAGVRIVAAIVGLLFIGMGFSWADGKSADFNPPSNVQAAAPVSVTLADHLGEGQVSEQVSLLVDGKYVGNVTVNQDYPDSTLTVTVDAPGRHSYTAEAKAVFLDQDGSEVELSGAGQGMVDVQPGRTYSLRGSMSGAAWLVSIEQEPQ